MPIVTARITGSAVWGGPAGAVRQHVSDGHYELTICNGRNAGFDMAGVTDGMRGVTMQTNSAWADVGSVGLYPLLDHLNRILALPR